MGLSIMLYKIIIDAQNMAANNYSSQSHKYQQLGI